MNRHYAIQTLIEHPSCLISVSYAIIAIIVIIVIIITSATVTSYITKVFVTIIQTKILPLHFVSADFIGLTYGKDWLHG